jgi:methyltransferase-like protein
MARARPHGLQYLGEAQLAAMNPANFPDNVRPTLNKIGDIIVQEQYMDFLRNRLFRQTLLCRRSAALQRNITAKQMKTLSFQGGILPADKDFDWSPGISSTFRWPSGQQLSTQNPLLKAAMLTLIENRSRAVSFSELLRVARQKVADVMPSGWHASADQEEAKLASSLLGLVVKSMLEAFAEPVAGGASLTERPMVAKLNRYQAQRGKSVTNRLHHTLPLDAFGRAVLLACDGERAREEIVDYVVQEAKARRLVVQTSGKVITEGRRLREILHPRVEALLALLERNSLLVD